MCECVNAWTSPPSVVDHNTIATAPSTRTQHPHPAPHTHSSSSSSSKYLEPSPVQTEAPPGSPSHHPPVHARLVCSGRAACASLESSMASTVSSLHSCAPAAPDPGPL